MPVRLQFLERALQGLAYWMGHRSSYNSAYPLPEAALVSEACNLLQANLEKGQSLFPEVLYRRLVSIENTKLGDLDRADLAILSNLSPDPYKNDVAHYVQYIIELKRGTAPKAGNRN